MNSSKFFRWMEENGIKTGEMAPRLGLSPRTLSGYKSKGLPKDKILLCQKIVDEWHQDDELRNDQTLSIETDDGLFSKLRDAGLVQKNELTEFALERLAIIADAINNATDRIVNNDGDGILGKMVEFPFYGAMAAGEPVESQLSGETITAVSDLDPASHAVFEVNGESGGEAYPDGSRWIVELVPKGQTWTAKKGRPAVFCDNNGCYLKIYRGGEVPFASVDPNYKDLHPGDSPKLIGYPVEMING